MRQPTYRRSLTPLLVAALFASCGLWPRAGHADGPADNHPETVRRIPKLGIEVPAERRETLEARLKTLDSVLKKLASLGDAEVAALLPDIRVLHRAVDVALRHQEFFDAKELDSADQLLEEAFLRAEQLSRGEPDWASARGLVVRGYVSKLDGSVQPYGLVIPESYDPHGPPFPVHLWLHGRGETLSEVNFLQDRRLRPGNFSPADAIVVHPYGRYSNANKFAGEIDVLEVLDDVRRRYRIDDERIAVRGFSMGGASTWQLAVHYPTRWAAANPGAGFSETPEFLRTFQQEELHPTWWEQRLWRMYDCNLWARNLWHCPTIAYSGEDDRQKQAADVMEQALADEGIELLHVIGPKTGHSYHPDAAREVAARVGEAVGVGRDPLPRQLRFVTYTLRYNECAWLTVDGLGEHWERAEVEGRLDSMGLKLDTKNVTALTIRIPSGRAPFAAPGAVQVQLDGQQVDAPRVRSDRGWVASFVRDGEGRWLASDSAPALRKRPGLQGPIDDAFLDAFTFVRPTGKSQHEAVERWAQGELDRAVEHWRRHFRGDAQVRDDTALTDAEIASRNLVLWGDPDSNAVWRRIADQLPIVRKEGAWHVRGKTYDASGHIPVLIYPNPLNPERYVVLNSSFTFREYAYLNNARQVPMLPDWAMVDLCEPPGTQWPGKIVDAGFFDESWQVKGTEP